MQTLSFLNAANAAELYGVQIPKPAIEQAELGSVEIESMVAGEDRLSSVPARISRQGWAEESARARAEMVDDELLLDVLNDFDQLEWSW